MSSVHPVRTLHCTRLAPRTTLSLSCLSNRSRQHVKHTATGCKAELWYDWRFPENLTSSQFPRFGIKTLTRGANGKRCQGPAESSQVSVLWAESFQAVRHQLVQGLRQSLQILFQLKRQVLLSLLSLGRRLYTVYWCVSDIKPYQTKQSSSGFGRPAADRKDSLPPFSWSAPGAGQPEESFWNSFLKCCGRIIVGRQNLMGSRADPPTIVFHIQKWTKKTPILDRQVLGKVVYHRLSLPSHWIFKLRSVYTHRKCMNLGNDAFRWRIFFFPNLVVESRVTEFLPKGVQFFHNDLLPVGHGQLPQGKADGAFLPGQWRQQRRVGRDAHDQANTLGQKKR